MKARAFLWSLIFVALAGALAPRAANAQEIEDGKFTLPFEVHWGHAVLPAGTYSISKASLASSTPLMYIHKVDRPSVSYFVLAISQDVLSSPSDRTRLVLDRKDGEIYVRRLQDGNQGLEFQYAEPKSDK